MIIPATKDLRLSTWKRIWCVYCKRIDLPAKRRVYQKRIHSTVVDRNIRPLDELRWNLIWGLNLGSDRLDNAVEEARAVARIMEGRLITIMTAG